MADVAALITEHCFEYLDAPPRRVGGLETPIPFARNLEAGYLPKQRFKEVIAELLAY